MMDYGSVDVAELMNGITLAPSYSTEPAQLPPGIGGSGQGQAGQGDWAQRMIAANVAATNAQGQIVNDLGNLPVVGDSIKGAAKDVAGVVDGGVAAVVRAVLGPFIESLAAGSAWLAIGVGLVLLLAFGALLLLLAIVAAGKGQG